MNLTTVLILSVAFYVILLPLLFWSLGLLDRKRKSRKLNKALASRSANKNELLKNSPDPVWPKWKERLKFTRSDKRPFVIAAPKPRKGKKPSEPKVLPISRKNMYWILRGVGLLFAVIGGLTGLWQLFIVATIVYFATVAYGYKSADKLMTEREKTLKRMFSVARSKLGQSFDYEKNPGAVIRVTEWRDFIKPQRVEFDIPDTFEEAGTEAFMKQFNQLFGRETAWVPADDEETGDPGWDFDKGLVTVAAVPPLPTSAPWDEHYVLDERVAWSFFPIGLGVEHGLELPNEKTGNTDNVLGFDLSGEQAKVAKKFGIKMAPRITTSPMVLIGGGTGGGKSLAVDTLVEVVEEEADGS